jgi:Na+-transporting NADH:ubiquinone oxidoreductase subunit NqrB
MERGECVGGPAAACATLTRPRWWALHGVRGTQASTAMVQHAPARDKQAINNQQQVWMSDGMKRIRMRIAVGGVILLLAGAAWFFLISFGPR